MKKRVLYYQIDFVATNAALQVDITEASKEDLDDVRAWLALCMQSIEACIVKQADLIAGCLVPVPDGEACMVLDLVTPTYFQYEGKLYRKTSDTWGDAGPEYCSFEELKTDGSCGQMSPGTIVQRVRLVDLE